MERSIGRRVGSPMGSHRSGAADRSRCSARTADPRRIRYDREYDRDDRSRRRVRRDTGTADQTGSRQRRRHVSREDAPWRGVDDTPNRRSHMRRLHHARGSQHDHRSAGGGTARTPLADRCRRPADRRPRRRDSTSRIHRYGISGCIRVRRHDIRYRCRSDPIGGRIRGDGSGCRGTRRSHLATDE